MNVEIGLKPRGISIYSICIFCVEECQILVDEMRIIIAFFIIQVIDVLSKLAGLWVNGRNEIMYSQASQITFICPMIFNYFPLDTQVSIFVCSLVVFSHAIICNMYILYSPLHFLGNIPLIITMLLQVCKFQVGSYSYNMEKMIFHVSQLGYAHTSR